MSLLALYVPSLSMPAPPNTDFAGSGSPEGVVTASPPRVYMDTDTNELYFKASGDSTTTGWQLVSGVGGSGGTTETFHGSGSPEGVRTASVGNTYFDTTNSAFYVKKTGSGNTGWYIIAG